MADDAVVMRRSRRCGARNLDDDIKHFSEQRPIIIPFWRHLGQLSISVRRDRRPPACVWALRRCGPGFVALRTSYSVGLERARASSLHNSAAVPQAVAMADKTYAPVAEAATVQVAASVIVTAILTPLLTSWWYKRVAREEARKAALSRPPEAAVAESATSREVDLA